MFRERITSSGSMPFSNSASRTYADVEGTSSRIPRIQGAQECTLTAEAVLAITTHRQPWSRPPIELDFSGRPAFIQIDHVSDWDSRDVHGVRSACTLLEGV